MKQIIIILFLLASDQSLYSNWGATRYSSSTGILIPIKNDHVYLKEEKINIQILDKRTGEFSGNIENFFNVKYYCNFKFENTSEQDENVIMAFPIKCLTEDGKLVNIQNDDGSYSTQEINELIKTNIVKSFITKINNRVVSVKEDNKSTKDYDIRYIVEYTFKPKEIVNIETIYDIELFSSKTNRDSQNRDIYQVNYIWKTIKTWKRPVEKAELILDIKIPLYLHVHEIWMEGWKRYFLPKRNVYSFVNFNPDDDFTFTFTNTYSKDEMIEVLNEYREYKKDNKAKLIISELNSNNWKILDDDFLRNAYYWLAEKAFRIDAEKAINEYLNALLYCQSNKNFSFKPNDLLKLNLKNWINEAENNAPGYYIAYNIACAYSIINNFDESIKWLRIAFELNNRLKSISIKDKDLENVRKERAADFTSIINNK